MKKIEVLVVDDVMDAAKGFSALLRAKAGIAAQEADTFAMAKEVLAANPIKVIILDQSMPKMSGTEMFKELKALDSRLRFIMLSGEASTDDLDVAHSLGYDGYLHKNNIVELPEKVRQLLTKYEVSSVRKEGQLDPVLVWQSASGLWPFRHSVEMFILDILRVEENYVPDNEWVTVKQVNAGETVTHTLKTNFEKKLKFEGSWEQKLSGELGLNAGAVVKVQGKLSEVIVQKLSAEENVSFSTATQTSREYRLPDAPTDPSMLHLLSKHFQEAPVFSIVRVTLERRCSCCKSHEQFAVRVLRPNGKFATRQKEFRSDGTERMVETGTERRIEQH